MSEMGLAKACSILCCMFPLLLGYLFAIPIASIIIGKKYMGDPCLDNYDGISFDFPTFLYINGIIYVTVSSLIPLVSCVFSCVTLDYDDSEEIKKEKKKIFTEKINKCTYVIILPGLAWGVVGTFLFFKEVGDDCFNNSKQLYRFGLFWVIYLMIMDCINIIYFSNKLRKFINKSDKPSNELSNEISNESDLESTQKKELDVEESVSISVSNTGSPQAYTSDTDTNFSIAKL